MTTTLTKNFVDASNNLYKARVKDGVEQIKVNGEWINLNVRGKYLKTKTLLSTNVNHSNPLKKSFTEGKRYQIAMHAGLGRNAGYIYENDGDGWQLTRDDEVGYDVGYGMYKFEAAYK